MPEHPVCPSVLLRSVVTLIRMSPKWDSCKDIFCLMGKAHRIELNELSGCSYTNICAFFIAKVALHRRPEWEKNTLSRWQIHLFKLVKCMVLKATRMKTAVVWNVVPCSLVGYDRLMKTVTSFSKRRSISLILHNAKSQNTTIFKYLAFQNFK